MYATSTHFLSRKASTRDMRQNFSSPELQLAIINPDRSKFAQEFVTKLLLWTGEPKSLLTLSKGEGYDFVWWNARLRDRVASWFTDQKRESKLLQILNREGAELTEEEDHHDTQHFMDQQHRIYGGRLPSEEQLERSLAHWQIILDRFSETNPMQVRTRNVSKHRQLHANA